MRLTTTVYMFPTLEMVAKLYVGTIPPGSIVFHADTDAGRPVTGVAEADVADRQFLLR
jgi:hypothetical protein